MLSCRRRSRPSATADRWRGFGGTGRVPQLQRAADGNGSCSFTYFASDVLALIADALALVRLARAHLPHLGRDLADLLLVDTLDDDLRRDRYLEGDSLRRLHHYGMGEADIQPEIGTLQRRAIADALQLEALLESLGDALDHVRDQRARQAVQRPVVAALGGPGDRDRRVALLDLHPGRHLLRELAQGPVDHHAAGQERDVHPARDLDWLSSDPAHLIITRRSTRLRRRFLSLPLCAR